MLSSRNPVKLLVTLILVLSIFIFANKQFFNNQISFEFIPRLGQRPASYIFEKLSLFRNILTSIRTNAALINKNRELENKNNELIYLLSKKEIIEQENSFLHKAINMSKELEQKIETGNIYTWSLNTDGYSILLNKGEQHGISIGNIVITDEKVLIGTIEKVENKFSRILAVTDPKFKITAKILGSNIFGIANGALNKGMELNLISEEDQVKEGDVVISSGNDIFPNSLILGRVSKIELTENQLFKKVEIEPAMKKNILGLVIILK